MTTAYYLTLKRKDNDEVKKLIKRKVAKPESKMQAPPTIELPAEVVTRAPQTKTTTNAER
eukprot:CAMPEP_0116882340 /NCGR_PEP_ID=MMETSP0463-20121206/14546_1 /TAXON_ID=181622 /ORGANISM="Strombidinopsis sp, Strain SopsisLIS2011" /LENGTH=59 /DNA_ID=CAMNT_0004535375 /DNA_START=44 /DNA_END=226 /DNA_ORIENTATION=-